MRATAGALASTSSFSIFSNAAISPACGLITVRVPRAGDRRRVEDKARVRRKVAHDAANERGNRAILHQPGPDDDRVALLEVVAEQDERPIRMQYPSPRRGKAEH